jgi:hypothetical protein
MAYTNKHVGRWEIYWGSPSGSFYVSDDEQLLNGQIWNSIVSNLIMGAKQAGIQHAFVVSGSSTAAMNDDIGWNALLESNIPYTCIQTSPDTYITDTKSYTYRSGIQGDFEISSNDDNSLSPTSSLEPICLEDLASLCVQCVQSLDWTQCRKLLVSATTTSSSTLPQESILSSTSSPQLRVDQQWCVNSYKLQQKLANIV